MKEPFIKERITRARSTSYLLLLGLSLGNFLVILDANIANVALPVLQQQFGGSIQTVQWIVNAYLLTSGGLLLSMGAVADKFGSKRIYNIGLAGFGFLSLLCALAWSPGSVIVFRALLGVSGAALLPASLALVNREFTEPAAHAKALGTWAAISGFAMASGPLLGGVLTHFWGWRSIFAVSIPVALAGWLIVTFLVKETPTHNHALNIPQQAWLILGTTALTLIIIEGNVWGWLSLKTILTALSAVLAGALFHIGERRSTSPLIESAIFRKRQIVVGALGGLFANVGFMGIYFFLSLFYQAKLHFSTLQTGLEFLALTIPAAINPPFSARWVTKVGPKKPLLLGFSLTVVACLLLLLPAIRTHSVLSLFSLVALGYGITYIVPPLTILMMQAAPKGKAGIVSAFLNSSRQLGTVLGVALIGAAMGTITSGMHVIAPLIIAASALAMGLLTAWRGLE